MKRRLALGIFLLFLGQPVGASQGFSCKAKGISLVLSYGHAAVASLINHELVVGGKIVPSEVAQSWSGDALRMVDLADPEQVEVIAKLRLRWISQTWRGTLWFSSKTYKVTCEELG